MLTRFTRKPAPQLRPLDPEQAAECAILHAPAFAHPWSEFEFERLLAAGNCVGDGAFDAEVNRLLGFVLSRRAADEAEILTVVVEPGSRRRGVGRSLLATHFDHLATLGLRSIFLEVEEDNRAALALYRHFDFHEVGRRKGYYRKASGVPTAALVMRRDID